MISAREADKIRIEWFERVAEDLIREIERQVREAAENGLNETIILYDGPVHLYNNDLLESTLKNWLRRHGYTYRNFSLNFHLKIHTRFDLAWFVEEEIK